LQHTDQLPQLVIPKTIFAQIVPPTPPYYSNSMRARVYVSIKPTVLDPQGQTICSALNGLGHREITSVRQGKYFEVVLTDAIARDHATSMLDEIAKDVLSNPVIEDYRVEIVD
jgi:phosphoribosylformylglycinamidine synthase subunit PurS